MTVAATISAQVSVYPMRQEHLAPAINAALDVFCRHGLDIQPGTMSTQITGGNDEMFAALKEAFEATCKQGEVVVALTVSNACPASAPKRPAS